MDFSPYLRGIQQVPGKTPGEKFKSLNQTARKIANDASRDEGGTAAIEIRPTPTLPEVLIPLVRIEVAKILRQPEEIVVALKSGDSSLVSRALTCKWFFNGSLRDFTNASYFVSHIFLHLSLRNRAKVIRCLAKYLNRQDPTVAEEFYEALSEKYGTKQAEPLLLACRETFIWSTVETRRLTLSIWTVQRLHLRYPNLIAHYLKFLTTDAINNQNSVQNIMVKLRKFLSRVFKYFPVDFIDILLAHKRNFDLKLNSKLTLYFFQQSQALEALLAHPKIFLPMLSHKVITKKLTRDQFKSILVRLLPCSQDEIQNTSKSILKHLQYFPEEDRILLFLSAFEERYGISYLECNDAIDPEIIIRLPKELRVDFARRRIQSGEKFHENHSEYSWVCYLPTREAIQAIINQFDVTSNSSSRSILLESLIYTCHVNNDTDALLDVLSYIETRYENERGQNICRLLEKFNALFKIENLIEKHWYCVMRLLTRLQARKDLHNIANTQELVMKSIFFSMINDRDFDREINFFLAIAVEYPFYSWSVLQDQPLSLQQHCLHLIIENAPSVTNRLQYLEDSWLGMNCNILNNIYQFNKRLRTSKIHGKNIERMSPKNYAWLCEDIRTILAHPELNQSRAASIKAILKKNDPEFLIMLLKQENENFEVSSENAVKVLKKDHENFLRMWPDFYENCKNFIDFRWNRSFIKRCRWYEDLPIKFMKQALDDLSRTRDGRELIILALLVEGKKFEEIIEPFIPTAAAMNVNDQHTKIKIFIIRAVMMALNVANDVLSSEIYLKYLEGDYLSIVQCHLSNHCQRAKVKDVLEIAEKLLEVPGIAMKKHGIRLFFAVATLDRQMEMIAKLMDTEKHQTNRHLLCKIVRNNFISQPGSVTFAMMCNCLEKILFDDGDIVKKFVNFDGISGQYIAEYFKVVLAKIVNSKKLMNSTVRTHYICRMIDCASANIGCFFLEDYHQELLAKYFVKATRLPIMSSSIKYLVDQYIGRGGKKLQFRFNYFLKIFTKVLKKYRRSSHRINWIFQTLLEQIFSSSISKNLQTKFLKIISQKFQNTVKPQQAPWSYMKIQLSINLKLDDSSAQTAKKITSILLHFIEVFSDGLTEGMAEIIFDSLKNLHVKNDNFNSYFSEIVKCLLEYDQELITHLCAFWLTKDFFC